MVPRVKRLAATATELTAGLVTRAAKRGVAFSAQAVGGMFGLYFRDSAPQNFAEVMQCDREAFNRFFHACIARGVYFAPSAYEAGFVSSAHDVEVIRATLDAAEQVFAEMKP